MKVTVNIALCGILAGIFFLSSCGDNTISNNVPGQLKTMESYINTNHYKDSGALLSGDLWYYRFKKGTNGVKIQEGDEVSLQYVLFVVNSSTYLMPYATNIFAEARTYGLDTVYANLNPITVTVGSSGLFEGFDEGLKYLYDGDGALLLFPSTMGYGEEPMGIVPANSPLAIRVYVNKVE